LQAPIDGLIFIGIAADRWRWHARVAAVRGGQGGLDVHRLRRADQVALRAEVDRICDQRMQLG
jgi:hypothetical protein